MKELSKSLRLDYLQYKDLLQMTQLRTSGISKEAEARLRRGEAINQLIIQDKNKPISIEEQIVYLYALSRGVLDNLSAVQIKQFKKEIMPFIEKIQPGTCADLRNTQELSQDIKAKIETSLKQYLKEVFK
jgi:F-type H+-transporting ATPase subunit alpha